MSSHGVDESHHIGGGRVRRLLHQRTRGILFDLDRERASVECHQRAGLGEWSV